MIRTYKYRIYPNKSQQAVLNDILWAACWLYNRALDYRKKVWRESRRNVNYFEQCHMWARWRSEFPDDNPLQVINAAAGKQILRRLDGAFKRFFQGSCGYPRFKSYRRFKSVPFAPGSGAKVRGESLYVQNVGLIRVRWHRSLPDGDIRRTIIIRKPSGWYVCFQIKLPFPQPRASSDPLVGIDMGLVHALALSDGTVFDSPQYLKQSLAKLRRLKRMVERRKRGSRRHEKALLRLAKQSELVSNQRYDWWHKVTRYLVENYGQLVLENLSLRFMVQNRYLARTAHDVGLGIFRTLLDYKAMEAGVEIVMVDPRGTSQLCSGCREIVQKNLKVREHHCNNCGLVVDRDINAAVNISRAASAET